MHLETMLAIAFVAEKGRRETRFDYYALCWRQYLVPFMFGICVWQRAMKVYF